MTKPFPILNPITPLKRTFELVAKRSNGAQGKSLGTILGDVITGRDKSFYLEDNINGSNEIDTYLYGVPYNSEFNGDAAIGPNYENYIKENYPNKNIKTYNSHFGDTLYIDNSARDRVAQLVQSGKAVGGSMGRYAEAPSYIITKEDGRPYDAGGHLMTFSQDPNGNTVANMSDIYDFLPNDFKEKYSNSALPKLAVTAANAIGTPFIVRQNGIPVVFKQIVPEYKTDLQKELGEFLSQWGDYYDLSVPLNMTDDQIKQVLYDTQYGDEILKNLSNMGLLKRNNGETITFKHGGFLPRAKSGIHIKPENKGKFTETKKRTGKTTEELTHSKNPLTRKRAIFAQNAKKWNHKDK